ncbi:MAG TPA: hypothetical protein VFW94_24210 [Candidatus Acidoferrales bacterium]|nr:hypothetical protein [Candidatus Acidoferrales bacterium]
MLKWLREKWYAKVRQTDLKLIWPACRKHAADLDHAKAAFSIHAFQDKAWLALGEDGIKSFIDALK